MEEDEPEFVAVLDNGTGYMKAGVHTDEFPKAVFPSCVGLPKRLLRGKDASTALRDADPSSVFVGQAAVEQAGVHLNFPLDCGDVSSWDAMELVWRHTFEKGLGLDPQCEVYGTLVTEAPRNPTNSREKMAEIMFEALGTPRFYLAMQAMLALLGSGRDTGLVVDAGDGDSVTGSEHHHSFRQNIAGRTLSHWLAEMLSEVGVELMTVADLQVVKRIKEELCRVSLDFDKEMLEGVPPAEFEMPDGTKIKLDSQRIRCPELLFCPSLRTGHEEQKGLHHLVQETAAGCEMDVRCSVLQNVILSGGTTCFEQLPERLTAELQKLSPSKIHVIADPARAISVWLGGAVLSGLSTFEEQWITKEDFEDAGPRIVHKKCPMV